MEDSSRATARAVPSNSSSAPASRPPMFSFGQNTTSPSSSADASNNASMTQRLHNSRRRRMLGRLVRGTSDARNTTSSTFNAEAPEFVPLSSPKTPSKRKASNSAKAGKSSQSSAIMESPLPAISTRDPPVIRSADVMLHSPTNLLFSPGKSSVVNSLMESSDDDEDMEVNDVTILQTIASNLQQPFRGVRELPNGIRLSEGKKRPESSQMLSAVLVVPQRSSDDLKVGGGGSNRLRYLPLCPTVDPRIQRVKAASGDLLTVIPAHRDFVQRSECANTQSKASWPSGELPVELFDIITTYLARDDIKTMRVVNQEFEQKVSRSLFHTSVVPFNTEIYDMIDEDRKSTGREGIPRAVGKGKMRASNDLSRDQLSALDPGTLQWQNAKEDKDGKVYKGHGLRVFQGFGPHIKRFGMSFEISEQQLAHPPIKKELDHVQSYHGSYAWPSLNYARFATLAGLENTADETSRMKAAFANLEIVQELALSIDSGLGWLNGPDKSVRSSLFGQHSPVFGTSNPVPDHATRAAQEFWDALQQSQAGFGPNVNMKETTLEYRPNPTRPSDIEGLRGNIYSDTQLWSAMSLNKVSSTVSIAIPTFGIVYTTGTQPVLDPSHKFALMPGELNKEQREWLLETQWAQQAFLESYMLAVIDNPTTFANVTTLNIAKLSSRFLPMLARDVLWEQLPQLTEVILKVSPDWRTVDKDDAGVAQTTNKYPSESVRVFQRDVLECRIAPKESIKKLTIGWVAGGEHASGMFARNSHLLPAPLTKLDHCTANSSLLGLVFNHVEHLTLTNCWVTPPMLEGLVKSHANRALRKLTLDSVSMTAHPRFPSNFNGAGAQQFAQAMAAMQAMGNNHQAQQLPQPPNFPQNMNPAQMAMLHQQFNQQWQQQFQQLQQQMNANLNPQAPPMAVQPGVLQNAAMNTNPPNTGNQMPNSWTQGHREGSWPQLIDLISPGPAFMDYLPAPAPWEEQFPSREETSLRTIEFISCGYAKLLNHTGFDQYVLEPGPQNRHIQSPWFRARHTGLKPAMMTTTDRNIGQIVQYMPPRETNALQLAWGLTEGWQDYSKAEEAEYDGFAPGGTGRFSGVVRRGMALVGQPETEDVSIVDAM